MKLLLIFLLSFNLFAGTSIIPDKDSSGNIINKLDPFATKGSYNFRGAGVACTIPASSTASCEYTVPYTKVQFNGVKIIGAKAGDKAQLKVLDTAAGTYSLLLMGTAIPNALLNQFGFDWYLTDEVREVLPYPATLNQGMRIVAEITNSEATSKNIYINFYIHEDLN